MPARIERDATARQSLLEQYEYIGSETPDAADRFLEAVEQTLKLLSSQPEMGKRWQPSRRRLEGLRWFPVTAPFENWLIFYLPLPELIRFLYVAHGARDLFALVEDLQK